MRLIDATDVLDKIDKQLGIIAHKYVNSKPNNVHVSSLLEDRDTLLIFRAFIDNISSASRKDVEEYLNTTSLDTDTPCTTAYWAVTLTKGEYLRLRCSNCGHEILANNIAALKDNNYCSLCGAKMHNKEKEYKYND